MSSGMGLGALPVDILPHDIKVRDIAGHHPVEGGLASEALRLVRLADPFVRGLRHEDLQALVDAHDIGNPLERILRKRRDLARSEEHTSELQSLMRISYAVFCLKKKKKKK